MIFYHVWTFFLLASLTYFVQGQDEACIGVTCNNRGNCIPNSAYSRGYWCDCDDGWAGQDCLHPEPTVQCGDNRIDVVIDKGLVQELEIDDDVRYVYFGRSSASPQCRAIEENNLYKLSIRSPFSSCGTQVIQRTAGDDYTFSNTVVWNREVHNTQNLIDRELILLDFKCIYEDTYTVLGPAIKPDLNVLHLITEQGKFDVRMRLFDDSSYLPADEYTEAPTIAIGTYVYVQVELEHVNDPNLVVTLDRCFASQSQDSADPVSTKHMLITDRCANPNDSTVQIRFNGDSSVGQFKFQMFKWRWSAADVYLHCEVDICNKTADSCTGEGTDCQGLGNYRKKREALTHEGVYYPSFVPHTGHMISQGPIHIMAEKSDRSSNRLSDSNGQVDSTMVALGVILGLVLVCLGVVGGVFARRRQVLMKTTAKKEAVEATNKRLTSLHFTTESF